MRRNMVDPNKDREFTQGSIFNCANSEKYPTDDILGLVITARCDIENDKVSHFNYLPLIPFSIWKNNELVQIIKEQKLRTLEKELMSKIQPLFSEGNIKTYGLKRVTEKYIETLRKEKEINSTKALLSKIETTRNSSSIDELNSLFNKEIQDIVKFIAENKNSNYYLIDEIIGYGTAILNLREILVLSKNVALSLADGVEIKKNSNNYGLNCIENSLASIVGQLKSPYIELVLQRFSNNFTRIGVENPNYDMISEICN